MKWWKRLTDAARHKAWETRPEGLEIAGAFENHTLWRWKNIGYLPTDRYLAFIQNQREAELGVKDADLRAFTTGISEALNKADIARASWFVKTLEFYLEEGAPERMLFRTGSILLLIDDEPPGKLTDKHADLKARLFETNPDFRAFFLDTLYDALRSYGVLSTGTQRQDFSTLVEQTSERIYSILTRNDIFTDYLKS